MPNIGRFAIKYFRMNKKQNTDSTEQPRMVKSHDIHIDAEYAEWIAELKHRYRSAQVKAAVKMNA